MSLQVGDRIEVVDVMTDDPLPPPIGGTGTVIDITPQVVNADDGVHYKAHIKWDGELAAVSTLLIPQDNHVYEVIT